MSKKKNNRRPKLDRVTKLLNAVKYNKDVGYIPSEFALAFINFIKLVNGSGGESHPSPVMHYRMLDNFDDPTEDSIANLCFRGSSKTTLVEYLILFCAVHGGLPNFGKFKYGLYVSDTIDNGVKKMRRRLQLKLENSEFLKKYIPKYRFTDVRWQFWNVAGVSQVWDGNGIETGVRGGVELGERPSFCIFDDLLSDKNAKSPAINKLITEVVYGAIEYALNPERYKIIWNGTPFNASDPLYKAINSGAWKSNVYPVCEKFPCKKKEFSPAWGERFTYKSLKKKYKKAKKTGNIGLFNRELLLRIMTKDEQLIKEDEIRYYKADNILSNRTAYNFYIVTDFATTAKDSADWSVALVIAVDSERNYYLVDGFCEKQTMKYNISMLFGLVSKYKPLSVGIEISGQQGGYLAWLDEKMIELNIYFTIAKETESNNSHYGKRGFRPSTSKIERFLLAHPIIEEGKFFISDALMGTVLIEELLTEFMLITTSDIKSEHDDVADAFSQIRRIKPVFPSESADAVSIVDNTGKRPPPISTRSPWDLQKHADYLYGDDADNEYINYIV